MSTDSIHDTDSPPQGEPHTNPETIEQLVERITQDVIGDADDLTIEQAQEITWRMAQALTRQRTDAARTGDDQ